MRSTAHRVAARIGCSHRDVRGEALEIMGAVDASYSEVIAAIGRHVDTTKTKILLVAGAQAQKDLERLDRVDARAQR